MPPGVGAYGHARRACLELYHRHLHAALEVICVDEPWRACGSSACRISLRFIDVVK